MSSQTTHLEKYFRRRFLEGKWRWAAFLGIYFVSGLAELELPSLLGAPHVSPGSDSPWYFIRQDFFRGVGSLAGIVVMLVIVAFTWRRYRFSNWLLLMMVAVWMVPSVVSSVIIYWRCPDFFRVDGAVAYWPTYDSYSQSGIKFIGIPVGFVLALLAGVLAGRAARAPSANVV